MTKVPSFTFAGGVLSRALWGRYDLNKYQTGLKKAENCVLSVEGGVEKRFGTYYTGLRKFQTERYTAKLIPWRIADDDSYILEFGHRYIRFIRLRGYVSIPTGHVHDPDNVAANVSGFMEVATPWDASAASELKYTFANDIMYIAHKSARPYQLQRLGLYDWAFTEQTFNPHPDGPTGLTANYIDTTTADDAYDTEPVPTKYKVSATLSDGTETQASNVVTVNADLGHRRTKVDLDWNNYADAVSYTVYKGANGIYGFIGYTESSDFTDRNFAPSYEVVPVGESVSFGGPNQNPRVIEFYKQRMAYAATQNEPQSIWLSRPYIFNSLRKSVPLQDDDAFKLPLVGRQRHTINHMMMLKKFLIFTDSAEWTLNTVENSALTAATADPVIETYYGAHPWLRPLGIGNRILFVQNKTGAVLDMGYEFTADAFKADDLTQLVRDLFKDREIVAWDYAVHPQNLLFCVLDDGTCNVMTYVREHEIWGWTTIETAGEFLDVACVTEIDQEGVYFQVKREIDGETVYFIERLEVNMNGRLEDMVFSDCSLSYTDSREMSLWFKTSTEIRGFQADHGLVVDDIVRIEISKDEYYIARVTSVNVARVVFSPENETTEWPEYGEDIATTVYVMASNLAGLDHLEGMAVSVLADGRVYKDLTIALGEINLPREAARIHIGLPFTARVETLDIDPDTLKGHFREKTVHEITINLKNSRGVFVGVDHPDYPLDQVVARDSDLNMYQSNQPLDGPFELSPHINWTKTTEIIIESRDPLPMNILNISPDIRYGSS